VTCMAICGAGTIVLLTLAMNPESIPASSFLHGVSNADWVTVWLFDMNVNTTISPTAATTLSGVKTRPAVPPTVTCHEC